MKPTWSNTTQQPSEFTRQFQNWRDEIYNYESTVRSETASSMKMDLLLQHIQDDIKSHLLLNTSMVNPDFENAATKVEEYYRNVYIDNNCSRRTKARKERKETTTLHRKERATQTTTLHTTEEKAKGKGKYNSRPYNVKGRGKGYNNYNSNYSRPKGSYNYGKGKSKGKGSKNKQTVDNIPPLPPYKGKGSTKRRGEGNKIANIYGIKEVTLVCQKLAIPTTFILSDVNCAMLGLDTITKNSLQLRVEGCQGHLARDQSEVQLHYIGNHFYLKATIFDGLYANWYYNWYDECDNNVYGLLQDDAPGLPVYADHIIGDTSQQEANIPKTYRSPTLPTQQEIDEHNLAHLPYRDWCKHCVQGKNKSQHHPCGGLS
eukprot:402951-Amphidinium_carterae.4